MDKQKKPNFSFFLEPQSGVPYYKQIILQVKMAMVYKQLCCGDQLPTVRSLSVSLGVNPNTIARAYNQLEISGYVSSQQGTGTFIEAKSIELPELQREKTLVEITKKFIVKASSYGFNVEEILNYLVEMQMFH